MVLASLLGGEMIVDERAANPPNFVGAHRRATSTATDGHTAIHLTSDHRLRQREHIVGIVIAFAQTMSAEIDNFMPRAAKLGNQLFLQTKSTMIRGNSHEHMISFSPPLGFFTAMSLARPNHTQSRNRHFTTKIAKSTKFESIK